jgi:hypothetical protein
MSLRSDAYASQTTTGLHGAVGATIVNRVEDLTYLSASSYFSHLPDRMHDTQSMCKIVFNPMLVPGGDAIKMAIGVRAW